MRAVPEPTYFWRQPGEELEQRDFIDRQKQPTKSRNETSNTLEDLRIEKGARSRYRDDDRRWGLETKRDDEGELTRISKAAQSVLRQNGGTEGWEVERRFEDSNRGGVASRSERQLLDRVNALLNEDFGYEQQHRGTFLDLLWERERVRCAMPGNSRRAWDHQAMLRAKARFLGAS